MKMEETSVIILAGGRSSRMGTDKAKLKLGGKTLLDLTVEKVQNLGISDIVISGCSDCPEKTRYAPDLIPGRGPLSGIHAGLKQIRSQCSLVLPVDMPLIPEETLKLLIAAHGSFPITALTLDNRPEPLVAVYDAFLAQDCEEILQQEKHSPRRLFDQYGYYPVPYTKDPALLINCNTPEEFKKIKEAFV
ncbi:MAG: molybdenum cofactor guanylyltransferase [Firmicutes bacterium]|nr:molybdenum cofactor guanylyltransferase [Bacillota bacterium]